MNESKLSTHQRLAEHTIFLIIGKIIASVSIIFLFILLSYLLSTTDYGSFRQVWMINKDFMEIFAFGVPLSILYFVSRLSDGQKKVFVVQSITLLTFFAVIFSLLIFLFAKDISLMFNNPQLERLLRIFCLYPLFALPTLAVESILISIGRTIQFAIFYIVDRILLFVLAATSVLFYRSLEVLFLVLVVFALFELIASMYLVYHFMKGFKFLSTKFEFREQLKVAFPSGLSNVIGVANVEVDKLMISSFFSAAQFAQYANGAFELPFIGTILGSVTSVLMPEYVKRYQKGDRGSILSLWNGAICRVAIFLIPLIVFLFIFASDFIPLVFSSKYKESALIFQIFLIALLTKVTWYGPILVSMGYNKEPFYASLLALVSNIILSYVFIKWIGFIGPAIATVLATYVLTFYYLYRIKNVMEIGWFQIFPWVKLLKILLISIVLGILFLALPLHNLPSIIKLSVGIIVYSILIYFAFRYTGLISKEDSEFINNSILKIFNKSKLLREMV